MNMTKANNLHLLGALSTLSVALAALPGIAAAALPDTIHIPGEKIFPESLTSSSDGSVIIGSIGQKQIYRARPGSDTAEVWIPAGTDGIHNILGVFADNGSNTLYACSNVVGPPTGAPTVNATLYTFDLKTGKSKGHYVFPTEKGLCNDIAVDSRGNAYATDTNNMEIVRLKKGGTALEVWAGNGAFGPKGGVLDGISVLGKRVVANTLVTSKLFSVPIEADGKAGTAVEVKLDRPISRPDGMRSFGKSDVLIIEGGNGGRLSRIALTGDTGKVTTIKEGYPDGPVAVTVVGSTAYVLEGQLMVMMRRPGDTSPPPELKPFKATAVEVGWPMGVLRASADQRGHLPVASSTLSRALSASS
jgi:sugar lactone lactonase YvrE